MIKSQSLIQPFDWIWSADPAVDTDAPTYSPDKYLAEMDRQHLPIREGAVATVFRLAPLSRPAYQYVIGTYGKERMVEGLSEAVAFGLRAVANWDDDGKPLAVKTIADHPRGDRVHADVMDKLFAAGGQALISELGLVVLKRSVPGPLSK